MSDILLVITGLTILSGLLLILRIIFNKPGLGISSAFIGLLLWIGGMGIFGNESTLEHKMEKINLNDLFYIIGVFLGDGFTSYQEKETLSKSGLDRKDFLKKARDPKTGRFLSTGKIGKNDKII